MSFLSAFKDHIKAMSRQLENLDVQEDSPADRKTRDIVKFTDTGFDINMNNMISNKTYLFDFEDSEYIIHKNSSNELVVMEMH